MSIEALNWARKIYVGDSLAKSLLRGIADYADEHGHCFPSHARLARDCEMSVATVKRRLAQLEELSLLVTFRCWLDDNGVRNREQRGRETSREIRLALDRRIDPPATSEHDGPQPSDGEGGGAISTPSTDAEGVPTAPHGVPAALPGESLLNTPNSEPPLNLKDSPQPPSGGSEPVDDDWKEFESDWSEPILRQSLAQQVWAALKPDERATARQAARGYVAWRKAQKKPPNVLGAHLFLKERDAWAKFAEFDPGTPRVVSVSGIPTGSIEAKAVIAMYAVARAVQPFESRGRIAYRGEVTPQLLAFADLPERSAWLWIEDRQQIGAWAGFLQAHVHGSRSPLIVTIGAGQDKRSGIHAPWPWPPRKDGTLSTTGPPEGLMSEQDFADFK